MADLLVAPEAHPLDAAFASERPRLLRLCARLTIDSDFTRVPSFSVRHRLPATLKS